MLEGYDKYLEKAEWEIIFNICQKCLLGDPICHNFPLRGQRHVFILALKIKLPWLSYDLEIGDKGDFLLSFRLFPIKTIVCLHIPIVKVGHWGRCIPCLTKGQVNKQAGLCSRDSKEQVLGWVWAQTKSGCYCTQQGAGQIHS